MAGRVTPCAPSRQIQTLPLRRNGVINQEPSFMAVLVAVVIFGLLEEKAVEGWALFPVPP